MNKLNGQFLEYYGFILVKYSGIMDMPQRLGETSYDWGDYQEPLVDEDDIFWKSRDFSMDVIFDERRTSKTLKSVIQEVSNLSECLLETNYGNFTVKVKEIQKVTTYDLVTKLTLILNERLPEFNAVLGNPIGGNGVLIDGYDFKIDFGITITKVKPLEYVPVSKLLNTTVFNTSQKFSSQRNFKVFELDCVKHFSSINELSETTEKFKKLLSLGGYRVINLNNENHNCFLTEGFKVSFIGNSLIKFKILLNIHSNNIVDEQICVGFVESGFIESGFIESGCVELKFVEDGFIESGFIK